MKKLIYILSALAFTVSANAQLDRSVPPKPQPNPEIKIDIPEAITLENGLKVIVVENHKLPRVSFQLFVDYPYTMEGDKAGTADLMGDLLSSGTTNTTKDDFDNKIDFMGADFFSSSRGFFASSLKKHTPELLKLLQEVTTTPAFPADEFDRVKKQHLTGVKSARNDASAMAGNVSAVVNYGKEHPYGEITTEKTLEKITLDDVKSHYKNHFLPNYAYLVIVGDVTQAEAQEYAKTYFGGWQKGSTPREAVYTVPSNSGNQVYFVDKPGAVQSVIQITHNMKLVPGHEDEIKLRVMNSILGGGSFSARLMSNLREDKAYTYGCYSSFDSDKLIGEFGTSGSFRNEVTDSAIVQIMGEISKISAEMVTDEELDLVKKSMTGAFARSLEQPETVARFALNTIRYNLPATYYADYLKKLEAITKDDVLEVAKKYLQPGNSNIIVVGNAEIAEKLLVFDSDNEISYKDHYGEEKTMLKQAPQGITAQTVIENYTLKSLQLVSVSEIEKKMKKVGEIHVMYKADIPEMGATLIMDTYKGKENKTSSLLKAQGMVVQKEWFNGESGGSFAMGQGVKMYEGEELEEKKSSNFPFSQMHYSSIDFIDAELMGIDEIDGVEYYKVKVINKNNDEFSYEYYNLKTGMLEIDESFAKDEEGNSITTVVRFGDYKDAGGILMPHKMEINAAGQSFTFEVTEASVGKKPKSKTYEGEF
ncbi:MAG: insulinase family protein [Flavobacteriales bacterium]|nr:insulinase family protein [Flavobacteriales bacterium]